MKFILFLTVSIFSYWVLAQSTADFGRKRDGSDSVCAAFGNECEKKLEKAQKQLAESAKKINCYKCCVGDLNEDSCKEYKNHRNCSSKKKCKCG